MVTTDKLRLVHSLGRTPGVDPAADGDPAMPALLPKVMIVTRNADRYSDLPADVDWAPDGLEAVANAITNRYDHIVVDVAMSGDLDLGCRLVRQLRTQHRVTAPIYLVLDDPLPSDRPHVLASGVTDVLGRDRRILAAVFRGEPVRRVTWASRTEPTWLVEVVEAMRLFIASEAEPRVRAIYRGLCARTAAPAIEKGDVVHEASQLLDDLEDRCAFLRKVGVGR